MKKYKFILLFLFCFTSTASFSQGYFSYLKPDSLAQNHLVTLNYQYMAASWGKTWGATGGMANIGINVARFFSKKIVVGVVADLKFIPGISNIHTPAALRNDFNSSFTGVYDTPTDSTNSEVIRNAFNQKGALIGNSCFHFGIMISLFPQKYGGILVQAKYGSTGFQIHSMVYGNPYVNEGGHDKVPVQTSGNWLYELSLKPYAFFKNAYIYQGNVKGRDVLKSFVVSVYYERLNFKSLTFNGTDVADMVAPGFIQKYGVDQRIGIKFGFAFY